MDDWSSNLRNFVCPPEEIQMAIDYGEKFESTDSGFTVTMYFYNEKWYAVSFKEVK